MSPVLLDHVALGLWKVGEAAAVLGGELGARAASGGPGPGYWGGQWEFHNGARLETIEPADEPGGFLHRFLERRGPGIHHVTFKVPSLAEICQRARELGYDIVGYDDSSPVWKEAFLHPKQALGIVIQFAEVGPSDGDGEGDGWQPDWIPVPPRSMGTHAGTPANVELVGLHMSARSAERARRQWGEVAGGECSDSGGSLSFTWPGAPLRIVVHVDPDGEERPTALELRADRPLALPEQGFPQLGARFIQLSGT